MRRLIVLTVFLTACVPSTTTVRLDTPLLEGLSVESETEDTREYTMKITRWRGSESGKLKAGLKVTSLKGQYRSSKMFFIKTPANTPRAGIRQVPLEDVLYSLNVTEEGDSSNRVGKLQYLRLANPDQQCAYLMQFSGITARFENQEKLLGTTRIEAWYCNDTLSQDTMETFFNSVTY